MLSFIHSSEKLSAAWQKIFEFVRTGASLSRMIVTYDKSEKACG
jgi:hypothetical protein